MAHYAQVVDGIVRHVIVAEAEFIATLEDKAAWVQTSYNTHCGVHLTGGVPLRKNFAGIGFTYDAQRDAFIPMKRYASWSLNEETCQWEAPVAIPDDGQDYRWDEGRMTWVPLTAGLWAGDQ